MQYDSVLVHVRNPRIGSRIGALHIPRGVGGHRAIRTPTLVLRYGSTPSTGSLSHAAVWLGLHHHNAMGIESGLLFTPPPPPPRSLGPHGPHPKNHPHIWALHPCVACTLSGTS